MSRVLSVVWLLGLPLISLAQSPLPQIKAVRIESGPKIDGRLDDPVWQNAEVSDHFTQVEPLEGAEPTERTEIRILYDSRCLYIGASCLDRHPESIAAKQMPWDGDVSADDHVVFVLDTFQDKRNGYQFRVSAAGGRADGLVEKNESSGLNWDCIWEVKCGVDESGWHAEIAIPLDSLFFDPLKTCWGFNIERTIQRTKERLRWACPALNQSVLFPAVAGNLTGLEGLRQGKGIFLKPYVTTHADVSDGEDKSLKLEPGFDAFYNITPSVSAGVTVNTDFSDTEVDQQRVNLSRFPLFYPEKRDFFLQDAGLFEFGGIASDPLPFFSRRIGIVDGEEKDILAGVKATGRQGKLRLGILDVQMKEDDVLGDKNLGVARLTYDVLEESTMGVIATNGDPAQRGENQLAGMDFNYRKTRKDGDLVTANLWIQTTRSDPEEGEDLSNEPVAFGGRVEVPNEPWCHLLYASQVGEDFNPAMGFSSRPGRREVYTFSRRRWRPEGHDVIQYIDLQETLDVYTFLDNEVEDLMLWFPELQFCFRQGEELSGYTHMHAEDLKESFEIVEGVTIPAGQYEDLGATLSFSTSASRPWATAVAFGTRTFYEGTRQDATWDLDWRPSEHVFAGLDYEVSDVRLDQGDFFVHVVRAKLNLALSPELSWSNIVQWDNQSDQAGVNSRVRWDFHPGHEVFLVYNDSLDTETGWITSEEREVSLKLGLTFGF